MHFNTSYQSPNHNARPVTGITHIVLHYTDLPTAEESLSVLCDPERKVSAHYLIDYDGTVYQLVADGRRAWHAGVSTWAGRHNVNDYSLGIELQNKGHSIFPLEPYPLEQLEALIKLLAYLTQKHEILPCHVIGHSDIAPDRKRDPGEHFDWHFLKARGYGKCLTLQP